MTADAVGGVWSYALDLASAFVARGIAVTLAVMGPKPEGDQRAEAARCGVHLVDASFALEWMTDPWIDVARAGEWLQSLEGHVAPDLIHLNAYSHAALQWHAPVVVVAHSCVRSWWRAVHGMSAPPEWDRYTSEVSRGLASADLVVAPTAAMLADVEAEYGALPNSYVIPNGRACVEQIVPSPLAKLPFILSAGRIWDAAKNIQALCDVAPSLPWPVYVAGDERSPNGDDRCTQNVEPLGKLAADAMQEWYTRAAVYALPALYEPFGLSILEAAAAGCALVLGDIPSLRENWADAALFVRPDDRSSLSRALRMLIDDPAQRADLGERAKERSRDFTLSRMATSYLDAYARADASSRMRPAVCHPS